MKTEKEKETINRSDDTAIITSSSLPYYYDVIDVAVAFAVAVRK